MEPLDMDMFFLPTPQRKVRRRLKFENQLSKRRDALKIKVEHLPEMM